MIFIFKMPLDKSCFMDYMINESYNHGEIYGEKGS